MSPPTNPDQSPESLWGDITVEQKAAMRETMRAAVHEGFRDLLADDDVVDKLFERAFAVLKKNAATASGEFLIDSAWAVAKKVFWFTVAGIIVYMAGGWGAVVGLFKFGSLTK